MRFQAPDGTLPSSTHSGRYDVRSDVLAQALRIGMLLRSRFALEGDYWDRKLGRLAQALILHVQDSGAVSFSHRQKIANAWCAMFSHQALSMYRDQLKSDQMAPDSAAMLI